MARAKDNPLQMDLGFSVEEMTPVPPSEWTPPEDLPDRLEGTIGFDLETCDRGIQSGQGAGWAWEGGGHVVGYAVAADNFQGYLPIAHQGGGNLDAGVVRRWLNKVMSDENQPKVGASVMYDLGWARRDGVIVRGPVYDVQWAEALLDEHRGSYTLNSLMGAYLSDYKEEALLREAAASYGVDPKGGLWRLPAPLVGAYAEGDAVGALNVWKLQAPRISEQGLDYVFRLEHDLMPMYLDMRWRGVRIDETRAVQIRDKLKVEVREITEEIRRRCGVPVELWGAKSIGKAFDSEGIPYNRTPKNNLPSMKKGFLEGIDHWLPRLIVKGREKDKLAGTFIDSAILGNLHRGRVHGEIHPLRGDDGGTVTGRLSMSNPNLQFMPARKNEGKEIRKMFLPEEGEYWASSDFSQQEPRLLVHFASKVRIDGKPIPGALEARDRYIQDPGMSYHDFAKELTGLPYKRAKILNLAIIYGRGIHNTAIELGLSKEETKELFLKHQRELPFGKAMADLCMRRVSENGYIVSLSGRRSRFPDFEPSDWSMRSGKGFPLGRAKREWPNAVNFVRFRLHKALNSLIQPSAGDQTKEAMRAVWQADLGSHILIQIHDELASSVPDRDTALSIRDCMRDAVTLEVPVKVDLNMGHRWEEWIDPEELERS